jgi:cytochrome c
MAEDPRIAVEVGRRARVRARALPSALALACLWPLSPAAAQQGNAADGAEVFKKCRACHDVGPDAKNKVGPELNDLIGRTAGTVPQFAYSEANKAAGAKGLIWNEEALAKYLADPRAFMPGTKMAFAGLKDAQDRNDLVAYLKSFSKK